MADYGTPLEEFAKKIVPKDILEVGLGWEGISARTWLAHTEAHLTSVDREDARGIPAELAAAYPGRFTFIMGDSAEVLPTIKTKFDLVYIDGEHRFEGAYADIKNGKELVRMGGIMLIDDYGVEYSGVHDYETGDVFDAKYGVREATDELMDSKWKRIFTDIPFANGGVCFRRVG